MARMKVLAIFFSLTLLGSVSSLEARAKVGLALSGGGARGLAHIGVLKVLEKNKIPIDYITGTSIGAIVGGLYAAGMSPEEIEKGFKDIDWEDTLYRAQVPRDELPIRNKIHDGRYLFNFEVGFSEGEFKIPPGLLYGQKLSLLLKKYTDHVSHEQNFNKLPIPFATVATDLETGKPKVFRSGDLESAMRASASYPGLFAPVEIEGQLYIDGGISNNLPVRLLRKMGAQVIIAVDVSSPLKNRDDVKTFFDVTDQTFTIFMKETTQKEIRFADLVITPLNETQLFDFSVIEETIQSGIVAAEKQESNLQRLSIDSSSFKSSKSKKERVKVPTYGFDSIKIEGAKRVNEKSILAQVHLKTGEEVHYKDLKKEMNRIYNLGDFENVDYQIDKNELVIRVTEKRWGPNYLRFHLDWIGEIKGRQDFNILANFEMNHLNALGAQWRNDFLMGTQLVLYSEFFQPLLYSRLLFFSPIFMASRKDESFYQGADRIAIYEVDTVKGGFDFGTQLYEYAEIRSGLRFGFKITERETGSLPIPEFDGRSAEWISQIKIDQLNQAYFPTEGYFLSSQWIQSYKKLGAESNYQKIYLDATLVGHLSSHIGFLSANFGSSLSQSLPIQEAHTLGGMFQLSGFREEELRGEHFGVVRLGYLHQIRSLSNPLFDKIYLGGWGEAGNIWQTSDQINLDDLEYAGTLAIGFETKLGPLFLAYGQAGSEHSQFYVLLGRTFGPINRRF